MIAPPIIIELVGIVPTQLLFAYAMMRMLNIDHLRSYWMLEIASTIVFTCFRFEMDPTVKFACGIFICFLPLFMSRGRFSNRLLVNVLAVALLNLCELPVGFLWIRLTGTPVANYEAAGSLFPEYLFMSVMHFLLLVLLLGGLYAFSQRLRASGEDWGAKLFVGFPAIQLVLLMLVAWLILSYFTGSERMYFACSVLAVICIAADAFIFHSMRAYAQKKEADRRAAELEMRMGECLDRYQDVVHELESTSKLRHDLRNQVQVACELARRGCYAEANEHLEEIQKALDEADGC